MEEGTRLCFASFVTRLARSAFVLHAVDYSFAVSSGTASNKSATNP